ncbi:MAG: peptide transporter [Ruminococcaceae bacterium]|nr:peptide transporter [Oscillospiraceae bacterium]
MRHLLSLSDLGRKGISEIFRLADEIIEGKYKNALGGRCAVLFFPASSIRTRVTFERGIGQLGGQSILFPSDALDKKEAIEDVFGYLGQWADLVVVRHKSLPLMERAAAASAVPIVNAMTDSNHPCEILSDLYALSKRRTDFTKDRYLFVGKAGNIGNSWAEAAKILGFELAQCCGSGYEIPGLPVFHSIREAAVGRDVICTDSLPSAVLPDFAQCQVTREVMELANDGAVLNPCPPFFRGEEVSADAIASGHFVGYGFKKHLTEVQQAVMLYCLS